MRSCIIFELLLAITFIQFVPEQIGYIITPDPPSLHLIYGFPQPVCQASGIYICSFKPTRNPHAITARLFSPPGSYWDQRGDGFCYPRKGLFLWERHLEEITECPTRFDWIKIPGVHATGRALVFNKSKFPYFNCSFEIPLVFWGTLLNTMETFDEYNNIRQISYFNSRWSLAYNMLYVFILSLFILYFFEIKKNRLHGLMLKIMFYFIHFLLFICILQNIIWLPPLCCFDYAWLYQCLFLLNVISLIIAIYCIIEIPFQLFVRINALLQMRFGQEK